MEYREFEKLGVKTSLLGFGCMRLPKLKDGNIDYVKADKMVDAAYKSGVNYFDTAYGYHNGESERFIGRSLDRYERSTYFLATKLPVWKVNSLEDAENLFNEQLDKLHKDYFDFYLLHALNKERFDKMVSLGVIEFCEKLKAEGKIKFLGFSFHDAYDTFERIINYRDWDFCQIQFNYMDTDIQAGMKGYKLAEAKQIPVIIMEPVKGGTLAKLPASVAKYFKTAAPGKSMASWALRWVASFPDVRVILSGMSDPKQVADNLDTFNNYVPMNEEEHKAVQLTVEGLKKRVKNGCTGCAYCMPCPSGVNIPRNFKIWNDYGMYRQPGSTNWAWSNDMDENSKAKNCISCGKCEKLCPQDIKIRENLKTLQAELDEVCEKL